MPPLFQSPADYDALLPPLLMTIFACATLLIDVAAKRAASGRMLAGFNGIGAAMLAWAYLRQWQTWKSSGQPGLLTLQGTVMIDGLSLFINLLVLLASASLLLVSYRYLEISHEHHGEYYALSGFAQCGMYFMATAADLVTLFAGLELAAISFYILVGFTRKERRSNEAALKYLLLGALSSGFLLYGFSILYGLSGSTRLAQIGAAISTRGAGDPFVLVAAVTVTVGLLFKVSAVPFHAWTPDAYDGAPTPVTGYLSVASKVASFAVLIRVLFTLDGARPVWEPILVVAAVLSLVIGTVAALTQDRLKRLFAYSSIAHAGYILLGVIVNTEAGLRGVCVYLLVYALMNTGAFALLSTLRSQGVRGESIEDLRGLSRSHPLHAGLFVILLVSLAGVPPTAGFLAKYFIFVALIESGHIALAVIAACCAAVSLYFYFRLVREMYAQDTDTPAPISISTGVRVALGVTAALSVLIGIFPEPILRAGFALTGGAR